MGEPFGFSKNFRYQKILCKRKGREYHDSQSENFLSHSTETFRRRTLLCTRMPRVSKHFMHERGEGGSITILSRKIYCLAVPKNFAGEHLCVSQNLVWKNFIRRGGREGEREGGREGGRFSVEKFLSHSTDKFLGKPFCVSEKICIETF